MNTFINFAPILPEFWIIILALLGVIVIGLMAYLKASGVLWRFFAVLLLILTLLNPSIIEEEREAIQDTAIIIIDESPSQKMGGRDLNSEKAYTHLKSELEKIKNQKIKTIRVGENKQLSEFSKNGTRLFGEILNGFPDIPRSQISGVFVITDGQITDVPKDFKNLELSAPIHTILTGDKTEIDRRISIINPPNYGIVGENVDISIKVEEFGAKSSEYVEVKVIQDGEDVATHLMEINEEETLSFKLNHGGKNVFEFAVEPIDNELTNINNKTAIAVNAVRDRLKVLLVSGEPYQGERAWRNILKSDPAVDLVHFTILRPPNKNDLTPNREMSLIAFPVRELFIDKIDEFDLIILDQYKRLNVLNSKYFNNIANFVENGGALLIVNGSDYSTSNSLYHTELSRILPAKPIQDLVYKQEFIPRISETGQKHPVTSNLFVNDKVGKWFRQVAVQKLRGYTVMTGVNEQPLLILDKVGDGRIAQLTSDQIWLWSRGYDGGGPQIELMRRMAHWLMKEPELEETDLRSILSDNKIKVEYRNIEDKIDDLKVIFPNGKEKIMQFNIHENGWHSLELPVTDMGFYKFKVGDLSSFEIIGDLTSKELSEVITTEEKMIDVANHLKSGIIWYTEKPDFKIYKNSSNRKFAGNSWLGLRKSNSYTVTGVKDIPLLPIALLLLLSIIFLLLAWRREGK